MIKSWADVKESIAWVCWSIAVYFIFVIIGVI